MWMGLVQMNVWMRGTSARLHGVPADAHVLLDGPRQAGDARALDLAGDQRDRLEVARGGDRKAGLDDVDAQARELVRDLELLGSGSAYAPGACSPSRSVVSKIFTERGPLLPPGAGAARRARSRLVCSVTSLTPLSGSGYAKGTQNPDSRFERKGWPCGRRC